MTEMYYLNNNGKVVRKFVIRSKSESDIISSCSKVRDELSKVNAIVIFEKKISEVAYFMVVSFDDHVMMAVWESNIASVTIQDLVSSKVLIVKDDAKNDLVAKDKCSEAKKLLKTHSGAVLKETKIADGEYRLVLFFTDEEKMLTWEKALGVMGT